MSGSVSVLERAGRVILFGRRGPDLLAAHLEAAVVRLRRAIREDGAGELSTPGLFSKRRGGGEGCLWGDGVESQVGCDGEGTEGVCSEVC